MPRPAWVRVLAAMLPPAVRRDLFEPSLRDLEVQSLHAGRRARGRWRCRLALSGLLAARASRGASPCCCSTFVTRFGCSGESAGFTAVAVLTLDARRGGERGGVRGRERRAPASAALSGAGPARDARAPGSTDRRDQGVHRHRRFRRPPRASTVLRIPCGIRPRSAWSSLPSRNPSMPRHWWRASELLETLRFSPVLGRGFGSVDATAVPLLSPSSGSTRGRRASAVTPL